MAKRYSAKFKFQVVTELLAGDKSSAQVAKAYGIHPNTINTWKQTFLGKGPGVFAQDSLVAKYERRIAELERLIGKKGVGIALSKTSWDTRNDIGVEGSIPKGVRHFRANASLRCSGPEEPLA